MSTMANNVVPKKNKGRQRVQMVRMEKDSNRQVTFSKRRTGLFKKASELCTLCGAQAAVIVYSPGGKAFSFGHPSVEVVLDRYLFSDPSRPMAGPLVPVEGQHIGEPHQNANVHGLNMKLTEMSSRIEDEKKRGEELNHIKKAKEGQFWWEVPMEELNKEQLQRFKASLEELKQDVFQHSNKLMIEATNNANNNATFMGMLNPMVGFNNNPPLFNPTLGFGYQHDYN